MTDFFALNLAAAVTDCDRLHLGAYVLLPLTNLSLNLRLITDVTLYVKHFTMLAE